jgi:H+/Cl- antiporter ClcA
VKNLLVLTGMSGAMGALFPTPVLGVLMIHELGNPPRGFMESTLLMSVSAIMAFIVFFQLEEKTWLERLTPSYTLSAMWEFDLWHCATAVVIGLVSSGCSLGILLSIGIVKQILFRIKERCDSRGFLNGQIVISTLGGAVIGRPSLPSPPLTVSISQPPSPPSTPSLSSPLLVSPQV